jgi:RloB-like protein
MPKKKPWKRRNTRKPSTRPIRRYLIVCEDEKSAADYLRAFKIPSEYAEVITEGGAGNTDSLVEKALAIRERATYRGNPYVFVWCVFDRDSFPAANFNRSFDLVRQINDVEVIWANECFELWYLLHFCYRNTAISRHELPNELSSYLGLKYDKARTQIYDLLESKMETALRYAQQLEDSYDGQFNACEDNPSTNVHHLIKRLKELKAGIAD